MRAQIQTQIFVYILAVVIAGLIIGFGAYWIIKITKAARAAELEQFGQGLASKIGMINYESMKTYNLQVPTGFGEACFIDLNQKAKASGDGLDKKPVIYSSWNSNVKKNFFFYPNGADSFYIGNITIDNPAGFLCLNISYGMLSFRAKGLGHSVRISSVV